MKILVTGGTGQLGGAVARALVERGDAVRALVRDRGRLGQLEGLDLELVEGDVTRPDTLPAAVAGVEAVAHLAGVVSHGTDDGPHVFAVNEGGTAHVLDAAAAAGVRRVLLTSSIAALGYVTDPDGVGDEDTPYNWAGRGLHYHDSKRAAEARVLGETRLEGVAVNPGITFGAGDLHQHGGRVLLQVKAGMPGVPSGASTFTTLSDVVAGHLGALDRGRPGQRYVLGGHPLTFLDLYARAAAIVGVAPPVRTLSYPMLRAVALLDRLTAPLTGRPPRVTPALAFISTRNRRYRSDKAIRELGYAPRPVEEGLRACWDWYVGQGLG
ncbi:MAG: NAD(P)H-binding protein [Alphaproteobacteria bacterium]|nr:NAD(P)H-binding protein [Alphaproteobacteria bacterium]